MKCAEHTDLKGETTDENRYIRFTRCTKKS